MLLSSINKSETSRTTNNTTSSELIQLLRENYTTNQNTIHCTHVSMINPIGKYSFDTNTLEKLWDIYCENVYNSSENNTNFIVGLAEKPRNYIPILVDVDLKILNTDEVVRFEDDHIYSRDHVLRVIEIYQTVLREIVEDCNDKMLLCVVLEKKPYFIYSNNNSINNPDKNSLNKKPIEIKNGFHLHFPNIFLSTNNQKTFLLPKVIELMKQNEVFANIGIEDSGLVIDKGYCSAPWLLYGSRKGDNKGIAQEPYVVSKVINANLDEITIDEAFSNHVLFDGNFDQIIKTKPTKWYLPRILSIFDNGRQTYEIRHGLVSPIVKQIKENTKKNIKKYSDMKIDEALKITAQLLPLLSDKRAEDESEWMNVGWALFNIGKGNYEAMEQWIEFSKRCPDKFDEAVCISRWETMRESGMSLGTLKYYASIDNPEKYIEFKISTAKNNIRKTITNYSHYDIAKILYEMFGTEFVCSSIQHGSIKWYHFKDHKWNETVEGHELRAKISTDLLALYRESINQYIASILSDKMRNSSDDCSSDACDKEYNGTKDNNVKLDKLNKILKELGTTTFKNNIMKEASELFYDQNFETKLNKNPNIVVFKNGVYDLKLHKFRIGKPEDYMSKSLPIAYEEYTEFDENIIFIKDFFMKVFPDHTLRKYFLDCYSDIFTGKTSRGDIFLWLGSGSNSKSITQYFFEQMLGNDLATTMDTKYFTQKKSSNGAANPELARTAPPVRSVFLEEPDGDEKFNSGELKKLSGGGAVFARDLFEKGKQTKEINPMFQITFICNKLPKVKYGDKALWDRFKVIPFESTFEKDLTKCPESFDEQLEKRIFPKDPNLKGRIPELAPALAWYLLQWRKNVGHIYEPPKVLQATEKYQRANDIYRQFIDECIVVDNCSTLPLSELYMNFRTWFTEGFPNTTLPIKNDISEYFEEVWGKPRCLKWEGYRIKTLKEKNGDIVLNDDDLADYDDIPI